MAKFAKGDKVAQIVTPISGEVAGFQVDQETGEILVKVEWQDENGHSGSRFFKETEIQAAVSE
jgi:hypothetical protein